MKIAKALKLKNQLAGEVAQLKELLTKQNSRSSKQKFDYDNREVLTRLRAKLAELVKVKAAVAAANAEIYDKIFRLAELKGLVTTLNGLDTKAGVFHEGRGFAESALRSRIRRPTRQGGRGQAGCRVERRNPVAARCAGRIQLHPQRESLIPPAVFDLGARWRRKAAVKSCRKLGRFKRLYWTENPMTR